MHYYMEQDGSFTPVSTGVCEVLPDDSSQPDWREADQRVDIINAYSLSSKNLFLVPQPAASETAYESDGMGGVVAVADPVNMLAANANEVLYVGALHGYAASRISVSGRLPNPTGSPGDAGYRPRLEFVDPTGASGVLVSFRNVIVADPGPETPGMEVTGNMDVLATQFDSSTSLQTVNVSGTLYTDTLVTDDLNISGTAALGNTDITGANVTSADVNIVQPAVINGLSATDLTSTTVNSGDLQSGDATIQDSGFTTLDVTGDLDIGNCTGPACPDILP
jgi:hypothetical protein